MNVSVGHIGKRHGEDSLNDRIFDVMEHIEYRRIVTPEDFEEIGDLRANAFDARVVYSKKLGNSAVDEMDRAKKRLCFRHVLRWHTRFDGAHACGVARKTRTPFPFGCFRTR
jgi:hypothetical protein